jgi:hypothetical protein
MGPLVFLYFSYAYLLRPVFREHEALHPQPAVSQRLLALAGAPMGNMVM